MLPRKMIPLPQAPGRRLMHRFQTALLLVALLASLLAGPVFAGEFQREFSFDTNELALSNLIGAIEISGGSSDQFTVIIEVRGDDAEEGLLDFVVEKGRKSSLAVKFPTDKHTKYVYPPMGLGSSTSFSFNCEEEVGGSWLKKIFSGVLGDRIKVAGRGSGLEVWADITIQVPEGHSLTMKNGVGQVRAENVDGDLVLDTSSGSVEVEGIRGDLLVDTGSGRVTVNEVRGDVVVDTGSGRVIVGDIRGNLLVDTGSGKVTINGVKGNLDVDTGSGSVQARRIESDQARIDTGSGSVVLELDRMGSGDFLVDTGSGSVELVLPSDASARIVADTGSGGIRNRVEDARIRRMEKDRLEMTIGDGDASVMLDTGSGSVTISRQ